MKKKESTLLNMVLTLVVITLVAGVSLGYINDITKGPKAEAQLARKTAALESVLPSFTNDPLADMKRIAASGLNDSLEYYPAYRETEFAGAAVVGHSQRGYNGLIRVMVGFNKDGRINNIRVLEQKETPGLGTKIKEQPFISQFVGKHPSNFKLKVAKDQGDVDALSGATISSRAFAEATQMAYDVFVEGRSKK